MSQDILVIQKKRLHFAFLPDQQVHLITKGSSLSIEVPSPGFPCFPTVVFSRLAHRSTNLQDPDMIFSPNNIFYSLGVDVDPEMKRLISAVPPEDDLRPQFAVRGDLPDDHHLLAVVVAEAHPLELHHHGQGGVVHGELGGKGDVVLLVRGVDQADVLGREGDLLARGGGTSVQLAGNPRLVPSTHCH